jgi:tetratricopeptide (TPR) repeat protein
VYKQILEADPRDLEAWRLLAAVYEESNRLEEWEECLRRALDVAPDDPSAHNDLARALAKQRKLEEAEEHCRQALALCPELVEAHVTLGKIHRQRRHEFDAEQAFREALRLDPGHAEAHRELGIVLAYRGRTAESLSSLREAVRLQPESPKAHRSLGHFLGELGAMADAEAELREALRLNPRSATAYASLAQMKRFGPEDPDLKAMEQLARVSDELARDDAVSLHFALAKAYDDIGSYDEAFKCLETANRLYRERLDFDIGHEEQGMEELIRIFDEQLLARLSGAGHSSETPVFIVGMPRSGTTLVEQVLASHPDVHGAGELEEVGSVAGAIPVMNPELLPFPRGIVLLERRDFDELGRLYLARVRAMAPEAARITDKLPGNFHYVGLIHLMLPEARIIHCTRDPADTCLSCYSTQFGWRGSYDLDEIGRYYRAYARLMEHWRRVLPVDRMLEVNYEDVIDDLEFQAHRLVEHCGLEWNDACLAFHRTERPVQTASMGQVRRPLYGSSVGRWRRYEKHLGPLLAALGEARDPTDR